jgi:hypothetical protein
MCLKYVFGACILGKVNALIVKKKLPPKGGSQQLTIINYSKGKANKVLDIQCNNLS